MKRFLWATQMRCRFFPLAAFGLWAVYCAGWLIEERHSSADLTVHEWGTLTAIAGRDGRAIEWKPLTGPTDLPGFVEHFSDANFKLGLRGTVRMETPVLYFYSPRDATVSVSVAFSKGVITEWYPHAVRVQPSGILRKTSLSQLHTDGTIAWKDIRVSANLSGPFPQQDQQNRYYAARETSALSLAVKTPAGDQHEKFLFYRGVSASPLPVMAKLNSDGKLYIKNLGQEEIPSIILFERRGEKGGYQVAGALTDETVLDPPLLTDTVDSLGVDLEGILTDQGLYPDEAHAMVTTWRDSWFEEGSRLIYIVPRRFVDNILSLTIDPAPAQVVRVFVGRLEIVTPATMNAVENAVASDDEVTLNKYSRFLEPILRMLRSETNRSHQAE